MAKQLDFYIDSAGCTGCKTCQLACKDNKDLQVDVNFRRVYEYPGGSWQASGNTWTNSAYSCYFSIACNHCADPACIRVCPSGAMHKCDEDGPVVVDKKICIGCKSCAMACPYGAPQFDRRKGHIAQCNGCHERVSEGKKPVCVDACPLHALDIGLIDELLAKCGALASVEPLPDARFAASRSSLSPTPRPATAGTKIGFSLIRKR